MSKATQLEIGDAVYDDFKLTLREFFKEWQMHKASEQFVDLKDACAIMGVSKNIIIRLKETGKLPYYMFGACIRYKKSELLSLCDSLKHVEHEMEANYV